MKTKGPCTRPTRKAWAAAATAARPKRMAVASAAESWPVARRSCDSVAPRMGLASPSTIEVWRDRRRDVVCRLPEAQWAHATADNDRDTVSQPGGLPRADDPFSA